MGLVADLQHGQKTPRMLQILFKQTNILRTPVELLKLVQQPLARLTGGSSALYNRHAV